jgi:ATPase family associated with various cellular activities (AAA)
VDIKSHYLRDALQEIMKDVKAVSLVENQPTIDPNMLFLHVDEMRRFYKKTLKARIKKEKKKKNIKRLKIMRAHLKLMVVYIDKDFDEKKKAIFPMVKAGNITFEYLWALFKPNSLAFTTTYGAADHPRCFKVDFAYAEKNFMRGEYYVIEGRYLDYDGKNFGLGDFEIQIDHFKGPRKITSLSTYPITFHKDPEGLKKQLLERGKQFVNLAGMNFKLMKGLAFQKRKKQVLKFNINGRVMIDPKTFRRINANYQVSGIKDDRKDEEESDSDECSDCQDEDDDDGDDGYLSGSDDAESKKPKYRVVWDDDNKPHVVPVTDDDDEEVEQKKLDQLPNGTDEETAPNKNKSRDFTEEELIIASPVALGFSFTEKSWFEFAVSDVSEIVWNNSAFETLVLPKDHKELVKAQVKSHKFHAAETIDDVIQGKGKGLVFVLHGPPGVGKTLTAEGIAEFLQCPLYAVSAGDLGTDARTLEHELNKIMDIAHSWGAVLLLDEADVFLEKRQHQDVHRNALVSIFLRLLEYFQGILFLTTNRVETFDEAFQSRIHIALKYAELGIKAKKDIWKSFIAMVRQGGGKADELTNGDYDELARHNLNGRQVKFNLLCNIVLLANILLFRSRTWFDLLRLLRCSIRNHSPWRI